MANPQRGEVAVRIAGKDYVLRPTFDCLCRIENAIGRGIYGLLADLGDVRALRAQDLAHVLQEGIRATAGKETPDLETVGMALMRDFVGLAGTVGKFLTLALVGEQDLAEAADPGNAAPPSSAN